MIGLIMVSAFLFGSLLLFGALRLCLDAALGQSKGMATGQ